MSEKTLFFVQPYVMRRHKLLASGALTFRSADEALETGVSLARRRAGVVVLAQSYDSERQVMNRPRVLRVHGQVPADWTLDRKVA